MGALVGRGGMGEVYRADDQRVGSLTGSYICMS